MSRFRRRIPCFAIAEVAPKLKFVVQGLRKVAEGVKERVKGQNNLKRIEFQAHSFSEPQLVKGADVYSLPFITMTILTSMRPKSWATSFLLWDPRVGLWGWCLRLR